MSDLPSPVKITPSSAKKGKQSVNLQRCIVCQTFTSEQLSISTVKGRLTILSAIEKRQDEAYRRIIDNYKIVTNIPVESINYHRSCYKTYTSTHNLSASIVTAQNSQQSTSTHTETSKCSPMIMTRSARISDTDWEACIFCNYKKHKYDKKLHKISSEERIENITRSATLISDNEMLYRISCVEFSEKAVYHSGCITKYLLQNVKLEKQEILKSEHDNAFYAFISCIKEDLLVHKKVFYLTHLFELFSSYLPYDVKDKYTSYKLQQKMEKYFGGSIVIQSQQGQGMSNIVYSSSISLSEAIDTVNRLKADIKSVEMHDLSSTKEIGYNEEQILYAAVGILRKRIGEIPMSDDEYPSPKDTSINYSLESIPPSLKSFLCCLIDDGAYKATTEDYVVPPDKLRKSIALAGCIVSINRNSFTPFHLGLALQMHHTYGSKNLVETLSSHGFCASYSEVRRYLTSLADHEVKQIENGTYIPSGILKSDGALNLIQEGADNVDINTETIDGKDTFHSMARAVFQIKPSYNIHDNVVKIKRTQERSLQVTEYTSNILSCLPFKKPKERIEPVRCTDAYSQILSYDVDNSETPDIAWVLLRLLSRDIVDLPLPYSLDTTHQIIPFWTGYFRETSQYSQSFSTVAYPPIVDSKPSDMSTVYTTMKRCVDMCERAGQKYSIQTFDQQLYAVAQQVKWSNPVEFQTHILRLGGFHALSCYIACIGKLWGDGGLSDLLVESGVYASGTVEQMLTGKQFNRAVRSLTLAYEATMSVWFSSFFDWCQTNDHFINIPDNVWYQLLLCHGSFSDNETFNENQTLLMSLLETHLSPLMEEFNKFGCGASVIFKYWNMFVTAVETMLQYIRAERNGLWSLHLSTLRAMLPLIFVANRTNYSRWTPIYLLDMLHLPPEINTSFNSGNFAIRQKPGSFNGVWRDMATEKTIIKDSKGNGGIVGLTRQKPALLRWNLTRHIVGQFSSEMRLRSGIMCEDDDKHDESRPACMKRDDEHVESLISHLQEKMINPFDVKKHPRELVNISTGLHASKEVQDSLLNAFDTGKNMAKNFITSSLSENVSGSFYGPIKKSNIKTFADMNKKTKLKCRTGEVVKSNINPELIFRRALALTNCRDDVTVEKLLSYPIGPIPTSLFHDDGTMRKCNKSDLIRELENEICSSFILPLFDIDSTVIIRDGMGIIQALDSKAFSNFGDLAMAFLKQYSLHFVKAAIIIDVFDRYDIADSIKSGERERRALSSGGHRVYQVNEGSSIPDWKKFLGNTKNKQALIHFLGEFISTFYQTKQPLPNGKTLYLAGTFRNPEFVKQIVGNEVFEIACLFSTQEEADTRIILHALHADKQFGISNIRGRIVIKCSDTDVLVLCVHYFPHMLHTDQLWLYIGTVTSGKDGRRYIPVHDLCNSLSEITCQILPSVHALTGCDTTSSFFGIGKKSVFKLLKMSSDDVSSLANFANSDIDDATRAARQLIASLYDPKGKYKSCHTNLNKLRVKVATSKESALVRLPPSESSFKQHVLRSCLQAKIWTTAHHQKPNVGPPVDYGWQKASNGLEPIFFTGMMSSDFLQDLICTCKGRAVCSRACVCFEQNLCCTELCPCQGSDLCSNALTKQQNEDGDQDLEDDLAESP